jgi:hypothetical protein
MWRQTLSAHFCASMLRKSKDTDNNNNNNSIKFFIIYVPSQQLQGHYYYYYCYIYIGSCQKDVYINVTFIDIPLYIQFNCLVLFIHP